MLICWIWMLLTGALVGDIPQSDAIVVELAAADPLEEEARQFLASQKIEQTVEKLVARRKIVASELPDPAVIPRGELDLRLERSELPVGDKLASRVNWSVVVPDSASQQFTYHVVLAHFSGNKHSGPQTWGIATSQLNGQRHALMAESEAQQVGQQRVLAILSVWSIKTEQLYVLDVAEAEFSVIAKKKGSVVDP